jgi:hypothetical protein
VNGGTDGRGGESGGGEGGRRRERRLRFGRWCRGTRRAVVPGPMVTLVMITKSLGSAISVEQFVLLAPAAGKREAFAREVEGRWVGRNARGAVPANA